MKNNYSVNLLLVMILLSAFGFNGSLFLNMVPFIGVGLALIIQLLLGYIVGRIGMPTLFQTLVGIFTIVGFYKGFAKGTYGSHDLWQFIATLAAYYLFLWGWGKGLSRAEAKKRSFLPKV